MTNHHCCALGCKSSSSKKENLEKYPWMRDITFHTFPTAKKKKKMRKLWINMMRRKD